MNQIYCIQTLIERIGFQIGGRNWQIAKFILEVYELRFFSI